MGTNDSTDLNPPCPFWARGCTRIREARPFSGKSLGKTVNVNPGRTPAAEPILISTTPSGSFRRIFACGSSNTNASLPPSALVARTWSAWLSDSRVAMRPSSLRIRASSRSRSSVMSVIFLPDAVSAAWYALVRVSNPSVIFFRSVLNSVGSRSISFWNLSCTSFNCFALACIKTICFLYESLDSSAVLYATSLFLSLAIWSVSPSAGGGPALFFSSVIQNLKSSGRPAASGTPSFLAIAALILFNSVAITSPGRESAATVVLSSPSSMPK